MSKHILKSYPEFGWRAGRDRSGSQVLVGEFNGQFLCFRFSDDGTYAHCEELPVAGDHLSEGTPDLIDEEKSIRIHEFAAEGLPIGVTSLPLEYKNFAESAWEFDAADRARYAVQIHEWKERHHFAFYWGNEFWCDEDGTVTRKRDVVVSQQS